MVAQALKYQWSSNDLPILEQPCYTTTCPQDITAVPDVSTTVSTTAPRLGG